MSDKQVHRLLEGALSARKTPTAPPAATTVVPVTGKAPETPPPEPKGSS